MDSKVYGIPWLDLACAKLSSSLKDHRFGILAHQALVIDSMAADGHTVSYTGIIEWTLTLFLEYCAIITCPTEKLCKGISFKKIIKLASSRDALYPVTFFFYHHQYLGHILLPILANPIRWLK
jgi:hypothetical protein